MTAVGPGLVGPPPTARRESDADPQVAPLGRGSRRPATSTRSTLSGAHVAAATISPSLLWNGPTSFGGAVCSTIVGVGPRRRRRLRLRAAGGGSDHVVEPGAPIIDRTVARVP